MAFFDFQPVDLANGERLLPSSLIKVKVKWDKDLPENERTTETEKNFRNSFKTSDIAVARAEYNVVKGEDWEYRENNMPSTMIRLEEKTPQEMDETVEYDLDEEDLVWLDDENKKRELKKKKKIKDEIFELAMDRLEKETYFKTAANDNWIDETEHLDDDCCICLNGDVDNANQIIYCDMCNIPVHQDCYGVPYIPEGQWLCRKCKLSPMESVKCELCPLKDGAFKQTADGKWAHVACAIWLNEVHFGNTAFLEPIEGVQNSLRRRQKLKCLVCKVKGGACLQCSKGSCVKSFHVTCAMQARLQMVTNAVEDKTNPDLVNIKRFVYCHVHGSVAVGDNEFAKNKKRAIEAIHRARRRVLNNAHSSSSAPVPTVDNEARKRIEDKVGSKEVVEDIMGFWFFKRKRRCGLPLIRRLQIKKVKTARVSTPRGEAVRLGRIVYEKARLLVELMHKREKNYLENITLERKILPSLLTPLEDYLVEFIKSLSPIDYNGFFRDDPLKQNLQNYLEIVKKPMYLLMMRKNAEKGLYKNEGEMKEHLDLIFKNCELFNKSNDLVMQYAKETQDTMNNAYEDFVKYLQFIQSWNDELNFDGNTKKKEIKEDKAELKEENEDEHMELRDSHTPREESNRRKRKGDSPKVDDTSETPAGKRARRDGDKDSNTPAAFSIFSSSSLKNSMRRFSLDTRLDSNSNKSQRRLTRGATQSSFNSYRDISVLSPETGATSCDSAVDSDMEMIGNRSESRSINRTTLSDPNALHHGDLVKVNGRAARVVNLTEEMIENPNLIKDYKITPAGPNEILVHSFVGREPAYARYERSCIAPLDTGKDKVEGIREAKEYLSRMICSK